MGFFFYGERIKHHQTAGASSGQILPAFSPRPSGSPWQSLWSVMVSWVGFEIAGFWALSGTMLSGWVPPLATPIQQRFGSEFTFPTWGVASDPSNVSAGIRGEYKRDPLTAAGPGRFLRSKGCRKNNWIKLGIGGARFSCAGEMKLQPFLFPSPLKAEGC